jgi:S1-C subfamily serine protease
MKQHPWKVLLWFVALVLIVGLACGMPTGDDEPTEEPVAQVDEPPVQDEIVEEAPSSVAVSNLQDVKGAVIQILAEGTFVDPEWGEVTGAGRGSGFIIDPSGIAVTNNHVVTGAALLTVWIGGDTSTSYNARVLGVSECSDLAVIDIEGDGFPFLEWYGAPVQIGLDVFTAGFPLGDPEYTLTKGIVSKENADGETDWASIESVIMHDATINPGNSGGPLIDENGKVVAINYRTKKAADQYFAIGKDVAIPIVEKLRGGQDIESVGINGTAVVSTDGTLSGIWVSSVASGSPAENAGLLGGDVVTSIEGFPLATDGTMSDYCDIIRTHSAQDTMTIEVLRVSTSEQLEGQLNGRDLSVVGTFSSTSSDSTDTSDLTEGDAPAFYTEEFDPGTNTVDNWYWFLTNGDENRFDIYTENGRLVFDINGNDIYSYYAYDPWVYENVRIDALVENRGKNNNNVSLICRGSDQGWYEFSIANNGLWWIYAYDNSDDTYNQLADGGSTAVNMGKDVNEYTIFCYGDTLSFNINGIETHTMKETNFAFREGQVGIGVSSFNVLPIIVEFDWVTISEP